MLNIYVRIIYFHHLSDVENYVQRVYRILPKPWVVYLIRVSFKTAHIRMYGKMTIGSILELAFHLSMMEEIYGEGFYFWQLILVLMICYVCLEGTFQLANRVASHIALYEYSIGECFIYFYGYFHTHLIAWITFPYQLFLGPSYNRC